MRSILTAVLENAEKTPERRCVHAISRRKGESQRTFGEVARDAGRAAASLAARGVRRGDVVVLIGTHHIDLYAAWLGTVWLGAIPTILAEPSVRIDRGIYWTRLRALLERIEARLLLRDPSIELADASIPNCTYADLTAAAATPPKMIDVEPGDLCLLQHSSGTTGLQKGVMLSHGAVMRHGEAYQKSLALDGARDVVATWLPLYHDMGMIGCFIMPLLYGVPVVWLSPFEWVANPTLLLEAVTQHRATLAWLPNFAYLFIAQRAKQAPGTFDLSSLRAVINCSEPVTKPALDAFKDRFSGADRLQPEALHTCYAMAENIFAVTASTPEHPPRELAIDGNLWREKHVAVPRSPSSPSHEGALVLVSSGVVAPDCTVRIADDSGATLPPLHAGRVLVRSSFLFDGYFRDPRPNLFEADGAFDTGDLGFLDETGHLYVTGRRKDLVIIGGKNVYPHDVEAVINEVKDVYRGRVVVFGARVRDLGTEGLIALVESELDPAEWPDLARRIQRAVPAALDLDLTDVRVVPHGELRKSTSGKLARDGNREWYLSGKFGAVHAKVEAEGEHR